MARSDLFGYEAEEIIGKHITTLIPPDHQAEEDYILSQIRSGQSLSRVLRLSVNGRTAVWCRCR